MVIAAFLHSGLFIASQSQHIRLLSDLVCHCSLEKFRGFEATSETCTHRPWLEGERGKNELVRHHVKIKKIKLHMTSDITDSISSDHLQFSRSIHLPQIN